MYEIDSSSGSKSSDRIILFVIAIYDLLVCIGWAIYCGLQISIITPAPMILIIIYAFFIVGAQIDMATPSSQLRIASVFRYLRYFIAFIMTIIGLSFLVLFFIYKRAPALSSPKVGSGAILALSIVLLGFSAIQYITAIQFNKIFNKIVQGKAEKKTQMHMTANTTMHVSSEFSQLSRIIELQNSLRYSNGSFSTV